MHGEFAVIGLGRFGNSVAQHLVQQGQSVMAIDQSQEHVDAVSPLVDAAVAADTTNERVLDELRLSRVSTVIVAIGAENQEASILTVALLKKIGAGYIIARAVNDLHHRVLQAVGADEIINPEREMGMRLASRLAQPSVIDRLELGQHAELAEVGSPESFVGQTIMELDIRNRYHVSIVGIRREDAEIISNPQATIKLRSGDILLLIGDPRDIRRVAALA